MSAAIRRLFSLGFGLVVSTSTLGCELVDDARTRHTGAPASSSGATSGTSGAASTTGTTGFCGQITDNTFYVAPGGTDIEPGTSKCPMKHIGAALALIPADAGAPSSVVLAPGTYGAGELFP